MPIGIYKRTDEARKHMSEAHIGKKLSLEQRKKISESNKGKHSYWKGKKRSDEYKRKMSKIMKWHPYYGKGHSEKTKQMIREQRKGIRQYEMTEEIREKISQSRRAQNLRGEKSATWKGGKTPYENRVRRSVKFKDWRKAVFERDNYICQNEDCEFCHNKKSGVYLHPHHIRSFTEYPESRFDVNNGITYCKDYHIKGKLHIGIRR